MTVYDERRSDEVDEASDESFPASDPPSTQPLHPGKPDESPEPRRHDSPRRDEAGERGRPAEADEPRR